MADAMLCYQYTSEEVRTRWLELKAARENCKRSERGHRKYTYEAAAMLQEKLHSYQQSRILYLVAADGILSHVDRLLSASAA